MSSDSLYTTCKACGNAVFKSASVCPQCGVKQKQLGVAHWISFGLVALVVIGVANTPSSPPANSGKPSAAVSSATSQTLPTQPLEVRSWRCDTEYGFVFIRGDVKNVSSGKLENVMAVGEFRTKSGELVKTEDALLEYNPIMPGQSSPFKAGGTENPQITSCNLSFKYLMGGTVAYTVKGKSK